MPNPKLDTIKSQLTECLKSFQQKRQQNKSKAFRVYLAVTILSAMVTILLGLQGVPSNAAVPIRNIALVLSATVTVLTAFDTFFNHRALWVRYTQTVNQLLGLQARIDYLTAPGTQEVPESEVDQLFGELERVLSETNKWWQDKRDERASLTEATK